MCCVGQQSPQTLAKGRYFISQSSQISSGESDYTQNNIRPAQKLVLSFYPNKLSHGADILTHNYVQEERRAKKFAKEPLGFDFGLIVCS